MTATDERTRRVFKTIAPRMFRCHVCRDVGWLETDPAGPGTVKRCSGPRGDGCPHDAHRGAEARRRASVSKSGRGDAEAI